MNETERQQIRHSAREEGIRRVRLAERERYRQIICSTEAQQREAFALHIATETDLSPEAARRVRAASPRQIEARSPRCSSKRARIPSERSNLFCGLRKPCNQKRRVANETRPFFRVRQVAAG